MILKYQYDLANIQMIGEQATIYLQNSILPKFVYKWIKNFIFVKIQFQYSC